MTGVELIAEERQRQISQEGWTPEHDDSHEGGEMAIAAACYAVAGMKSAGGADISVLSETMGDFGLEYQEAWPWDGRWDKRKRHDRKRQLVIAGALIAAELDRLSRLEESVKDE